MSRLCFILLLLFFYFLHVFIFVHIPSSFLPSPPRPVSTAHRRQAVSKVSCCFSRSETVSDLFTLNCLDNISCALYCLVRAARSSLPPLSLCCVDTAHGSRHHHHPCFSSTFYSIGQADTAAREDTLPSPLDHCSLESHMAAVKA